MTLRGPAERCQGVPFVTAPSSCAMGCSAPSTSSQLALVGKRRDQRYLVDDGDRNRPASSAAYARQQGLRKAAAVWLILPLTRPIISSLTIRRFRASRGAALLKPPVPEKRVPRAAKL